jgi:glycogen debranching enzyme
MGAGSGDVTELLSGQFYQVLGRSTAHQLWSSAMAISPVLRGLFGLEWNAAENKLTVTPHLPAQWDRAAIRRLAIRQQDRRSEFSTRRR